MDSRKLVDRDLMEAFHGELPMLQVSAETLQQAGDIVVQMMSTFQDNESDPAVVELEQQVCRHGPSSALEA